MNTAVTAKPADEISETHKKILEDLAQVPSEHSRFLNKGVDEQLALQKELLKGREVKDHLKESVEFLKANNWIPAHELTEKLLKLPEDAIPVVRKVPRAEVSGKFPREYTKIEVKFVSPEALEKLQGALELPQDAKRLLGIPTTPEEAGIKAHKESALSYTIMTSPTERASLMRELVESVTQEREALALCNTRTKGELAIAKTVAVAKGLFESGATYWCMAASGMLGTAIYIGGEAYLLLAPVVFGTVLTLINDGFENCAFNIRNRLHDVAKSAR